MNRLINICATVIVSMTVFCCSQTKPANGASMMLEPKKYNKVISDSTNTLNGKIEDLEIDYTVWGCACPTWIRTRDNVRNDTIRDYLKLHFYIEPANKSLELPNRFDAFKHKLKVTGQFYQKEDYPQGTIEMEEHLPKAPVFRYTKIQVVKK